MGASASTQGAKTNAPSMNDMIAKKTEVEVIRAVLPIYYTKGEMTTEEKQIVGTTWKTIINGSSAHFLKHKSNNPEERRTPAEHFGYMFYGRFYEIHSTSRSLFTKTSSKQSTLLVNMISFIVREIETAADDSKITKTLTVVANSHNKMGIKATEYGLFGEVLFWTIKSCLGSEVYTVQTHLAWIKFFSKILAVIIPLVVKYEIGHKGEIKQCEEKRMKSVHVPSDTLITTKEGDTPFSSMHRTDMREAEPVSGTGEGVGEVHTNSQTNQ